MTWEPDVVVEVRSGDRRLRFRLSDRWIAESLVVANEEALPAPGPVADPLLSLHLDGLAEIVR